MKQKERRRKNESSWLAKAIDTTAQSSQTSLQQTKAAAKAAANVQPSASAPALLPAPAAGASPSGSPSGWPEDRVPWSAAAEMVAVFVAQAQAGLIDQRLATAAHIKRHMEQAFGLTTAGGGSTCLDGEAAKLAIVEEVRRIVQRAR